MSTEDGWAALHLEMPRRVPRTEYSAEFHWDLIRAVTGRHASESSDAEERQRASSAFVQAWNYDLFWNTLISAEDFGRWRTRMGHAVYRSEGADWDANLASPFQSADDVLRFDPVESLPPVNKHEAIARFEADYRQQRRRYPNAVAMTGIYVTCISGLIDLFGWDLLLESAGEDPARFGELTRRYCRWALPYFEALSETADVPVVMIHDDMVWSSGPFLAPSWYRAHVFPSLARLLRPLRDNGKRVLFTSDGNYTEFISDLANCGVNGFVMEPLTDMASVTEKYGSTHVIVGNADTRILLNNNREEIRREVERCMAIGKRCPGFFMAVGNHIPPNTPVEAALYYNEIYEELARR